MTPSSPALCTERSWSALPIIRYINYDLWLLKALKCPNRCSPVTFSGPQDQLDDRYPRPPWCLTVRVVGHYFLPGQEPPTPCCVLKPPGLVRVRVIIYLSLFLFLYWGVCSLEFQQAVRHRVLSMFFSSQVFPALGVLSYRTTVIQNRGDLPLTFCLDGGSEPALAEAVSVVPSCGLIPPGCHQILTVRTTPSEESPRQGFSVSFRLNGNKSTKVKP